MKRREFISRSVLSVLGAAASVLGVSHLTASPVKANSKSTIPRLTKVPVWSGGNFAQMDAHLLRIVAEARKVASPSGFYLVQFREPGKVGTRWTPIQIYFDASDGGAWWGEPYSEILPFDNEQYFVSRRIFTGWGTSTTQYFRVKPAGQNFY